MDNNIHCKVWGEIAYPFPNPNGTTIWEWMNNFIPHYTGLRIHAEIKANPS